MNQRGKGGGMFFFSSYGMLVNYVLTILFPSQDGNSHFSVIPVYNFTLECWNMGMVE